ncbi:hypothetical protein P3875_04280 [Myroides sp. JBRI-B21084]|uniref:hypothetical protein n=1 Tax=Myroides sp. JBRI-B21084 TaxID=3119977 RepID=UPI0026E41071|nr:hypothetical protein [Paenimyroides cloacae]WKW47290.1 hypothetical protein P3875_04280 [Paenimyroides cloacae]
MIYNGLDQFNAADSQIVLKYKALFLLNTMRNLGFTTRKKFVDTCVTYISLEINYITINKIQAFWDGRDVTLIDEMEKIVEKIKNS